ncbi:hypothetical protein JCGZ_10363 [Jatropha curcas]|uniref:Large ribosomal subunit protein uL29m n=1 Tax=Jatropha curcas TaxID=180498 RepID=A0A067KU47_JATCU|nr:hypothetical protein JCGZ_10363 [Jatropha curcas]
MHLGMVGLGRRNMMSKGMLLMRTLIIFTNLSLGSFKWIQDSNRLDEFMTKRIQVSNSIMFMTRFIGRTLFSAAKSETSAAAAAATIQSARNPLEEFFEADRSQDEDKKVVYGRSWKASELRLKSWDDLQKLWYVLLKEKNMLMTQRQMLHAQNLRFPNPERLPKVEGEPLGRAKYLQPFLALLEGCLPGLSPWH